MPQRGFAAAAGNQYGLSRDVNLSDNIPSAVKGENDPNCQLTSSSRIQWGCSSRLCSVQVAGDDGFANGSTTIDSVE
ncbi:unnamed protein product [Prunus armeniaca]|uniref:Uncharacterized protein n=1 Tax=Prunus armeniaca TaxID=36596 RepID=A0A6J5VY57_PRUAR|nr:unnamed protein product [Prunus armeniaca]